MISPLLNIYVQVGKNTRKWLRAFCSEVVYPMNLFCVCFILLVKFCTDAIAKKIFRGKTILFCI